MMKVVSDWAKRMHLYKGANFYTFYCGKNSEISKRAMFAITRGRSEMIHKCAEGANSLREWMCAMPLHELVVIVKICERALFHALNMRTLAIAVLCDERKEKDCPRRFLRQIIERMNSKEALIEGIDFIVKDGRFDDNIVVFRGIVCWKEDNDCMVAVRFGENWLSITDWHDNEEIASMLRMIKMRG